jgi:hypothetical protein
MPSASTFRSRPYHVPVISLIASLTLATLTTGAGQDTTLMLFDGKTLTGWSGDPRHWTVEDGALVGRSTEAVPCKETTWLVHTGAPLEHFELTLEVQLSGPAGSTSKAVAACSCGAGRR